MPPSVHYRSDQLHFGFILGRRTACRLHDRLRAKTTVRAADTDPPPSATRESAQGKRLGPEAVMTYRRYRGRAVGVLRLVGHYLEMVVAVVVGMLLLDPL
jgi:hypothetical protein